MSLMPLLNKRGLSGPPRLGMRLVKKRKFARRNIKRSITKSMTGPSTHTIFRTASIVMSMNSNGFFPGVGVTQFKLFSLWFTNQNAYIWSNTTNYSTVALAGYTDIAALFDEVKIDAIEISITTGNDPSIAGGFGSAVICMATDYNDKNAPTSLGDVQQYADVRQIRLANNFVHKEIITPKFLTYSLDSSGAAIASSPRTGYVRSNLDIEHFGLKGAFMLDAPAAGTSYVVFNFKYKFICKIQK